jgi:hypothetical protein
MLYLWQQYVSIARVAGWHVPFLLQWVGVLDNLQAFAARNKEGCNEELVTQRICLIIIKG